MVLLLYPNGSVWERNTYFYSLALSMMPLVSCCLIGLFGVFWNWSPDVLLHSTCYATCNIPNNKQSLLTVKTQNGMCLVEKIIFFIPYSFSHSWENDYQFNNETGLLVQTHPVISLISLSLTWKHGQTTYLRLLPVYFNVIIQSI